MFEMKMSSFIKRGNELIAKGKTPEAMKLVLQGLQHYSGRILKAVNPYAVQDASLVVISLRHIADEIEKNNPGTAETVKEMSKIIIFPKIDEIEKVKKPNRR